MRKINQCLLFLEIGNNLAPYKNLFQSILHIKSPSTIMLKGFLYKSSPNWIIDRTFTITVYFPKEPQKAEKPHRNYRNPIYLAKEYASMIKDGQAKSEADLARKLGISRVRVNHFITLLKLAPEVIQKIEQIGDPMPKRYITERKLRSVVNKSKKKQLKVLPIEKIDI